MFCLALPCSPPQPDANTYACQRAGRRQGGQRRGRRWWAAIARGEPPETGYTVATWLFPCDAKTTSPRYVGGGHAINTEHFSKRAGLSAPEEPGGCKQSFSLSTERRDQCALQLLPARHSRLSILTIPVRFGHEHISESRRFPHGPYQLRDEHGGVLSATPKYPFHIRRHPGAVITKPPDT